MRFVKIIAFVSVMLAPQLGLADDPVDNHVKSALADIERYENQFEGKTNVNASTVKRTLKLLTLTRERLDKSANQSHASWIDADKRYKTLVAHLNKFLDSNGSSKSQEDKEEKKKETASDQASSNSPPKQMISQYRVRIKKIFRDIHSRLDTLDNNGPKPFQDPEYVKKAQQTAQSFRESLTKYDEFKNDPDVVAATEALTKYENMIEFGQQYAAKELAELGDVQARLKALNLNIRQFKQPHTPQEPYQSGQLGQWLKQMATLRQAAAEAYKPLVVIKQKAYLPNTQLTVEQGGAYDMQDVERLERSLVDLVKSIDEDLKTFDAHLKFVVANLKEGLNLYNQWDPNDPTDQANQFLTQGRAEEILARLAQNKQTAIEATHYAQLLKHPLYEERATLVKTIQGTIDQYKANHKKALERVRMPKPATNNPELKTIAKETLDKYDYVGDVKRLVVNANKRHLSKETSEKEYDDVDVSLSGTITLTGTETKYFYEWDEFQVATAEPVGDKHYIFYTTLKYFTRGDSTTPLNKWIISNRIQSCEIPETNIDKGPVVAKDSPGP